MKHWQTFKSEGLHPMPFDEVNLTHELANLPSVLKSNTLSTEEPSATS